MNDHQEKIKLDEAQERILIDRVADKVVERLSTHNEALIKETVDESLNSIMSDARFLNSLNAAVKERVYQQLGNLSKYIKDEIKVNLGTNSIHEYLRGRTKQYIDDNIRELVKETTQLLIKNILKKYTNDLERTKALAYSIESEINHLCMKHPFSMEMEKTIIKRLSSNKEVKRIV